MINDYQTQIKIYGLSKKRKFKIILNNFFSLFKKTKYNHKMIETNIQNDWNKEF